MSVCILLSINIAGNTVISQYKLSLQTLGAVFIFVVLFSWSCASLAVPLCIGTMSSCETVTPHKHSSCICGLIA